MELLTNKYRKINQLCNPSTCSRKVGFKIGFNRLPHMHLHLPTQRRGISSCTASLPQVHRALFQYSPVRLCVASGALPSRPQCSRYQRCRIWYEVHCPSLFPVDISTKITDIKSKPTQEKC